jgi:hypothetical protein
MYVHRFKTEQKLNFIYWLIEGCQPFKITSNQLLVLFCAKFAIRKYDFLTLKILCRIYLFFRQLFFRRIYWFFRQINCTGISWFSIGPKRANVSFSFPDFRWPNLTISERYLFFQHLTTHFCLYIHIFSYLKRRPAFNLIFYSLTKCQCGCTF